MTQGSKGAEQVANEAALRALGDRIERTGRRSGRSTVPVGGLGLTTAGDVRLRRSGHRRWSGRRKVLSALVVVVVAVGLALAGGWGYLQYRFGQFSKVHVASLDQEVPGQPFNMLVIGSDSRVGLNASQAAQAGSAQAVQGQRSDVVQIWHVQPATRQITVLSIPRDTLTSMVGSDVNEFGEFNRINASFNGGASDLVSTIEDNFGIPINHVVEVDFGGFEGAVNALGGIYLNFNYPAQDTYSGLDITTTGCQLLNGTQALAVARSRHYQYFADGYWQYDGTSDFGRIQRQDAFLRALISAARSKFNPLTINAFLGSLPQGIVIDDRFSLGELVELATDFHDFSPQALNTVTLPTISDGDISPWGDVLFVDQPAAQQTLVQIFGNELTAPTFPPPDTDLVSTSPPVVTTTVPTTAASVPGGTTAAPVATTTTTVPPFDPSPC
jgi:LCP family protein required for cell wall assembly